MLGLLAACGSGGGGPAPVQDFGSFASVVHSFEDAATAQGKSLTVTNLIVEFGTPVDAGAVAECVQSDNMNPTITVDESLWDGLSPVQQRALLFHEMGHCVLQLGHNNAAYETVPYFVPTSYMLLDISDIDSTLLSQNQDRLDAELFASLPSHSAPSTQD